MLVKLAWSNSGEKSLKELSIKCSIDWTQPIQSDSIRCSSRFHRLYVSMLQHLGGEKMSSSTLRLDHDLINAFWQCWTRTEMKVQGHLDGCSKTCRSWLNCGFWDVCIETFFFEGGFLVMKRWFDGLKVWRWHLHKATFRCLQWMFLKTITHLVEV